MLRRTFLSSLAGLFGGLLGLNSLKASTKSKSKSNERFRCCSFSQNIVKCKTRGSPLVGELAYVDRDGRMVSNINNGQAIGVFLSSSRDLDGYQQIQLMGSV